MKATSFFAVLKKELKSYVDHPLAYILAVVMLVANPFLYFRSSVVDGVASLRAMFSFLPWLFLFFVPALTMRAWAEERREQTLSLLLSYPLRWWQVIAGKLAATSIFLAVVMLITITIPLSLSRAGDLDVGGLVAQYLGAILMGMAMVAVGQWASTLSKNQVVSFITSIAVLFVFYLISMDMVLLAIPSPFNLIGQQLGMLSHYNAMSRGVIDGRDLLYFFSVIFVFGALSYAWLVRLKSAASAPAWRKVQASVAVMVAIAVVVNLFGQTWTVRADLTAQNLYSLSGATKTVLRDLDDTVRFTFYRSRKLPAQIELVSRDIQDVLSDYRKFGGGKVTVAVRYPDEDEDVAAEARQKGIPTIRFNVVRQDEFTLQEGYLGLTMEYLDKRESIPFVQAIDDLEYKLTRGILAMKNEKKPKVGYVSDFGGKSLEEWGAFSTQLRTDFIVEQINLSAAEESTSVDQIDESIDVLVIAGPTQTFSAAAIAEIEAYVKRGGKILWFLTGTVVDQATLNVAAQNTGLEALLAKQGLTVQKDVVGDLASHETVRFSDGVTQYFFPYPYWVRAQTSRHVLVGNVAQVNMPWPSSLAIDSAAGERITPLITTSDQAVHFTSNFQLNPNALPDFAAASKERFTLAAAVQDVLGDEGKMGRWVVIANNEFLDNEALGQYPQNLVLTMNAIDWLTQNEALVSIRSKQSQASALVWTSKRQEGLYKWGNIAGMPVLVAVVGAAWLYRRRRYMKS
ncbi:MAG: Gldg family protein [Parcubacteria group bacterium]|nr:Gldg family protein [Parcubacteria group bacterium]